MNTSSRISSSLVFVSIFAAGLANTALAVPTGHLGYLKGKQGIVSDARTGRETVIAGGKAVGMLSVSPKGDALYIVERPGKKDPLEDYSLYGDGWLTRPPYRMSKQLPGLSGITLYSTYWNHVGDTLYVSGKNISGAYQPATRRLQVMKSLPVDSSRDGRVLAFVSEGTIRVKDASGKERVIFSIKNPKPMLDAINRAKTPANVRDLKNAISDDWKNPYSWQLDAVALAPDGKRLYFASNAGTGMGASGNGVWALFACDLQTGKISILSKTGVFFARSPDVFKVSPDGKRLLMVSSAHSSAVENPCTLYVIDLLTQNKRELLAKQTPKTADTNISSGACWSPDSKYVAFAALYYSTEAVWKKADSNWDFDPKAWRLFVADAATGKITRVVSGAQSPSWGQ